MKTVKLIRCTACGKRIRDSHSHVGVQDWETGQELSYHARPGCQNHALEILVSEKVRGKVFSLNYYHSCGDEQSGFGCYAGCFRPEQLN